MKDDFESYLIDAVKKQPVLYDRNTSGYSNKECIEGAWTEVYREVRKNVKNINVNHCKLRWRTLRDRYVRQFAKTPDGIKHVIPEGRQWQYTSRLYFLAEHLKKRKCEETFVPVTIKKEMQIQNYNRTSSISRTGSISSSEPHSFSFVEAKSTHTTDSNPSNIPFDCESEKYSEYEPEIEMPQSSDKCGQFIESEFPLENFEIQEPELVRTDSFNLKVNVNENNLNKLLTTTNDLLQQQIKQNSRRSPNEAYFKVLDGYFAKLTPDELDKAKVEILNLIILKKKTVTKKELRKTAF